MHIPVIFLDKDGTLIEDVPYNVDIAQIRLMPGVAEGITSLAKAGFYFVIVSNQSGIAQGKFEHEDLFAVSVYLRQIIESLGGTLLHFYFCPHHPKGIIPEYSKSCSCRKPQAGMLLQAMEQYPIDKALSWFIGDILDDVEAGNRAELRTI
jgi:D-glycero-D-manno-heptose 1,7-bisphosphate phosphatase